jgi:predicted nucleic acid-binding Zn ribbon protein
MESAQKLRESLALVYWARVVGAEGAAASEAESVRDGVLFVRTKSSVWSHELSFFKTEILRRLNRLLGGKVITDIVFRAQGLQKPPPRPPEPEGPSPEELAAVTLDPSEKAELRAQLQALFFRVKDDRVRRSIAARLTADAKVRHWRLERGWRVCPSCAALHKTDYALCPLCRLCR